MVSYLFIFFFFFLCVCTLCTISIINKLPVQSLTNPNCPAGYVTASVCLLAGLSDSRVHSVNCYGNATTCDANIAVVQAQWQDGIL